MKAVRPLALLLAVSSCTALDPAELPKLGVVEGRLEISQGSRGAAYLFLYPRGEPVPRYVTAVSELRLSSGDSRFVFGQVEPNPYRLWAFLDADRSFAPDYDVLTQPGAGDRVAESVELNLQPAQRLVVDLPLRTPVPHEPPAFRLEGEPKEEVELPDSPASPVRFELLADSMEGMLSEVAFRVSLADADEDGAADDEDGDGIPELYPQVFLRFLPRPGQLVPHSSHGEPAMVIVPLLFDPMPFLPLLRGDPAAEVAVPRLQLWLLPQAQAITEEPGRGRVVSQMEAIPVGEYELFVLHESGQYWWLPNGLGVRMASQGTRFRVVHGTGADAGF